ncbi:MAG TPA: hypothetical protein VFK13_11625 [Gemmatimonadaceae bacterium]|nr:hypothetical protein [Gemmatimonadaceae bacterium]
MLDLFVSCAPGVERLLEQELRTLGHAPHARERGGVELSGTPNDVAAINLRSRLAGRVLVRLGDFHARALGELERRARALPWERYIAPGARVELEVTCRKSRLYHTGAVAERVSNAIASCVGATSEMLRPVRAARDESDGVSGGGDGASRASDDVSSERDAARVPDGSSENPVSDDAQRIVVRVLHDRCSVSADSSGAHLHRRGYRLQVARAPLRETLAAAALVASGWPGTAPLVDPLCGAGTIAIEGALIARRIPPGAHRRFAFMRWPDFDRAAWEEMHGAAMHDVLPHAPAPILASDRDAGAVAATRANAERAGVLGDIDVRQQALSACEPPASAHGSGWIVTNPPYGVRVGDARRLRDLYAQLGHVARRSFGGWTVALLSADHTLDTHTRLPLTSVLATRNGGIAVRVMAGRVPE